MENKEKEGNLAIGKTVQFGGDPGHVLQVFLNADMRCTHPGLYALAKKHNIDCQRLSPGQYVVFINSAKTMLKLFAANNVLATYRSPSGRLELGMIREIPKAFYSSRKLDFDFAVEKALTELLAKRRRRRVDTAILNQTTKSKVLLRKA